MFKRRSPKPDEETGTVDGGEYAPADDRNEDEDYETSEISDRDFGWEEGDAADRRRDPLRK